MCFFFLMFAWLTPPKNKHNGRWKNGGLEDDVYFYFGIISRFQLLASTTLMSWGFILSMPSTNDQQMIEIEEIISQILQIEFCQMKTHELHCSGCIRPNLGTFNSFWCFDSVFINQDIYIYVYMYSIFIYLLIFMSKHMCILLYTNIRTYIYIHVWLYICDICIYIYIYIHAYIHL